MSMPARTRLRLLVGACLLLALCWPCAPLAAQTASAVRLSTAPTDILGQGRLYVAGDEPFPATARDVTAWLAKRQPASEVSLLGGSYWFYVELRHDTSVSEWVLDPSNTLIDIVEIRVYGPGDSVQTSLTGYRHAHQYMLHYGQDVHLAPGTDYRVLIRFASPYFASRPRIEVLPELDYRRKAAVENVQILSALGALGALAIFNFLIFAYTRDKSHVYYSLYLLAYCAGWGMVFNIPAEFFGLHNLHLHYIPFFLLPVLNTLFYVDFLKLEASFPRLAALSRINYVLPLALLPACFVALSYAHTLATLVIAIWLVLGLVCGVASWRHGYRPARYFVLAFIAILAPAALILPANVGLIPDPVENAELFTLLGGTLDGILLAVALADRIKLLSDDRERYLGRLNRALQMARTDALTGMGNRYAFDMTLAERFDFSAPVDEPAQQMLVLIDLDGLKPINDNHGHPAGDAVLRTVADGLRGLTAAGMACFRIGGDEFAVVGRADRLSQVQDAFADVEQTLAARGFEDAGLSYGITYASEVGSISSLVTTSDERMYRHKATRAGRRSVRSPRVSSQ